MNDTRYARRALVIATVVALSWYAAAIPTALALHDFNKDVHKELRLAQESGSPAEMRSHYAEAHDALRENGYGGGQYAYFFKYPSTNTTVQYQLLNSYIEQTERLSREDNSTRVAVGMGELRERHDELSIDTAGWWSHQTPLHFIAFWWAAFGWLVMVLAGLFAAEGYSSEIPYEDVRNIDVVMFYTIVAALLAFLPTALVIGSLTA
jgi:hypothetical protein